jgi:hypothetical protein
VPFECASEDYYTLKEEKPVKKYIVLSMHDHVEEFLNDPIIVGHRLSELSRATATMTHQIAVIDRLIAGKNPCPLDMLRDSEFMTAEQKKKVLRQWDRFIEGGFSPHLFTDAVYQHLNLHCGFIAHYNRAGFYSTYWNDDLIAFARRTGMLARPVPGVFVNWEGFLKSFQCWGEWADMGASMLHMLKSHLTSTVRELEDEVIAAFRHDLERLYPLHLEERKRMAEEADAHRQKVVELTTKLDDMDVDSFLEERSNRFKELFPSVDPQCFEEARLASNLF